MIVSESVFLRFWRPLVAPQQSSPGLSSKKKLPTEQHSDGSEHLTPESGHDSHSSLDTEDAAVESPNPQNRCKNL